MHPEYLAAMASSIANVSFQLGPVEHEMKNWNEI